MAKLAVTHFGGPVTFELSILNVDKPPLDVRGKDRYKRTIAQVTCAGTDANAEQVRRGLAWTYTRYARVSSPLYAIQSAAQAENRGLWADPAPTPPWDWRRNGH